MNTQTDGVSAMSAELGLLARLQSLKVLLGTDAPEVRGWEPVVQQGAQATVNATISALKDITAMSERLEQTTAKLADENERLRRVWEDTRTQRDELMAHLTRGEPLPAWAVEWIRVYKA